MRDIARKPYKIMIVDDDPIVVKTLERLLFKQNYLFFSVQSGEEALKAINEIEPDIVLLDVFMQGISGLEVCTRFKQMGITEKIPVIFLTANNQSEEIIKGFQCGAVDYIIKPFNTEELLARVQTHLELKTARENLKQMNLIKTRFYSIITHDIKDALTGVKGVAEFLDQELTQMNINTDEIKKLSNLLLYDSSNLFRFVESLIKWDQIERDTRLVLADNLVLNEIIEQVRERFEKQIAEKQLRIKTELKNTLTLRSDVEFVETIITEVIQNAIKYSNAGGEIQIMADKNNHELTIEIADQGVGIDKDVLENIFRLDTPHPKTIGTFNEKGTGLGLIICLAMAKKIKGGINIESSRHHGAKVKITLPDLE